MAERMEAALRAVVDSIWWIQGRHSQGLSCYFCGAYYGSLDWETVKAGMDHGPDCPVGMAQKALEER